LEGHLLWRALVGAGCFGTRGDMVLDALIDLSPEKLLPPPKPHIA